MTRRREENEVQKHTLNLFSGDFQRLQDAYPEIGAGAIIRRLVRAHLKELDKGVRQPRVAVADVDV